MSAIVPIKVDAMTDQQLVCRMLKRRLVSDDGNENDKSVHGILPTRGQYGYYVQYDKVTGKITADGDYRQDIEKRLQHFYEFEKVQATAEDLGLTYTEQYDSDTGRVVSCDVEGDTALFEQLAAEMC